MSTLKQLLEMIDTHSGINNKSKLVALISARFGLTKDRSVFYCEDFAIRFSSAAGLSFSNTVLSLSNLKKVDHLPFMVCLVTPTKNHVFLANTTMLRKISHSSQQLRVDNIKGSFNGSDIVREFDGIQNVPANIERLFDIHAGLGFDGNLARLVEETNNISPTGHKYAVTAVSKASIMKAPERAIRFVASPDAATLKEELDEKVKRHRNEIILAALIENINVRGRIIEYLIVGEDEDLRQEIILVPTKNLIRTVCVTDRAVLGRRTITSVGMADVRSVEVDGRLASFGRSSGRRVSVHGLQAPAIRGCGQAACRW